MIHIHIHSYVERSFHVRVSYRNEENLLSETLFQVLQPADSQPEKKQQQALNINSPAAKRVKKTKQKPTTTVKKKKKKLHTSHSRIAPLCLSLGLLVRRFRATVLLVMSPAAQYGHRAGTAESRQSWQDGATGTYYI